MSLKVRSGFRVGFRPGHCLERFDGYANKCEKELETNYTDGDYPTCFVRGAKLLSGCLKNGVWLDYVFG